MKAMKREVGQWDQSGSPAFLDDTTDFANLKSTLLPPPESLRSMFLELDPEPPLPFGWEKCLNLQTGLFYFKNSSTGMSTAEDPRLHQQQQQSSRRCQSKSHSAEVAASDIQGDRFQGWTHKVEKKALGGTTKITIQEKHSKSSSELLSLNSSHCAFVAPSLELSLRLETPQARDSSSMLHQQLSSTMEAIKHNPAGIDQINVCQQSFLGPNWRMGPFPSNPSMRAKEEPCTASPFELDRSSAVCSIESSLPPTETEAIPPKSSLNQEQRKFWDFLGLNYSSNTNNIMDPCSSDSVTVKAEPMPSSMDQSAGVCTLGKVQDALRQSEFRCHNIPAASNSLSRDFVAHSKRMRGCTEPDLLSFPLLTPLPSLLQSRSSSPATSDASLASSSSSRHSSTTPTAMSFQGEELDGPPSDRNNPAKGRGVAAASVLVAVGCKNCLMFVMLSKENPTCPKCGSTVLLQMLPTPHSNYLQQPKRQRVESLVSGTGS